jgi:hypothetical protein
MSSPGRRPVLPASRSASLNLAPVPVRGSSSRPEAPFALPLPGRGTGTGTFTGTEKFYQYKRATRHPPQGAAPATVHPGVSLFAELLDEALTRPFEPRPQAPFEESLRAFEQVLAALPASSQPPRATWAAELGIVLPCTLDDLKRAFRRLAFETHPDRPGGSHQAFLRARALLDQALASLSPLQGERAAALRYERCKRGIAEGTRARSTGASTYA